MPRTTARISEIARVIVPVSDQDKAIDFYCGTLGCELFADVPFGDGERWVEVGIPGATTAIALAAPVGAPVSAPTGISFRTDDIDALHADLRRRGVDVDVEVTRAGDPVPPMFFFRDQDGNTLHVAQDR